MNESAPSGNWFAKTVGTTGGALLLAMIWVGCASDSDSTLFGAAGSATVASGGDSAAAQGGASTSGGAVGEGGLLSAGGASAATGGTQGSGGGVNCVSGASCDLGGSTCTTSSGVQCTCSNSRRVWRCGGTGGTGAGGTSTASGGTASGGTATTSTGGAGGCAPNYACQPTAPTTGDIYADCVARVNQFRACVCLGPLSRNTAAETCANQQAQYDSETGTAHSGFSNNVCSPGGTAQNECPGWDSAQQTIDGCVLMMFQEGPPPTSTCTGSCYNTYGHYINMTGNYSSVACGFYTTSSGEVWQVQNYFR